MQPIYAVFCLASIALWWQIAAVSAETADLNVPAYSIREA